jgi:hypothetical protein
MGWHLSPKTAKGAPLAWRAFLCSKVIFIKPETTMPIYTAHPGLQGAVTINSSS